MSYRWVRGVRLSRNRNLKALKKPTTLKVFFKSLQSCTTSRKKKHTNTYTLVVTVLRLCNLLRMKVSWDVSSEPGLGLSSSWRFHICPERGSPGPARGGAVRWRESKRPLRRLRPPWAPPRGSTTSSRRLCSERDGSSASGEVVGADG